MPVFTTEYGVASLVLKQIPYQGMAYVILRDTLEPENLLRECAQFCRMCGADAVYATGHPMLGSYPLYTALWEMRCATDTLPDTDAALRPVQEHTLRQWQELYNRKVRQVPNGAWMTDADGREMLKKGDGYFVHRGETLLGIGRAGEDRIDWVASARPGAGRDIVAALAHALTGEVASLTVASENRKAVEFYESMGFCKTGEINRWYRI